MNLKLLRIWTGLLFCYAVCFQSVMAQTIEFATLAGTPINTTGWNLQGAARVGNTGINTGNGELIIVDAVGFSSGSIFYRTPINLARCIKWIAEFEFRIADGSSADGLAFCYLDVPPTGFVNGGGLGIPGTANGLKIAFDNFRNCGSDAIPKIEMRYGNGYAECNGQPTKNNNDGSLSFIRNGSYHKCKIIYNNGAIEVYVNDKLELTGNQTFDFTGYFGFTASTGGETDRHSIKNVRIFTEMPPSNAGNETNICALNSVEIGTANNNEYIYKWTPTLGLDNPNISNPTVTVPDNRDVTRQLTYYVETSFKTVPGCSSQDTVKINILPRPRVIIANDSICSPQTLVMLHNSTQWNGVQAAANDLQWQWQLLEQPSGIVQTSNAYSPSFNLNIAQTYTAYLKATTPNNCIADTTIAVKAIFDKPVVTIKSIAAACLGAPIQFTSTQANNNFNQSRWYWDFGDGNTATTNNPTYTYNSPGSYRVKLVTASQQLGCISDTAYSTININANPTVNLAVTGNTCLLEMLRFTASATSNSQPITYKWDFGGGNIVTGAAAIQDYTFATANTQLVTVTATDANNCFDTAQQAVSIFALPTANAGPDKIIIAGLSTTLDGTASGENIQIQWSPANNLDNAAIQMPTANPKVDVDYVLTVTDQNNCQAKDSMLLQVFPEIKIPNAFSPNNDGINDIWTIRGLNAYNDVDVKIWDRYGRIVYASIGYNNPWNGLMQGKPLPTGMYYFIFKFQKDFSPISGSILLIR